MYSIYDEDDVDNEVCGEQEGYIFTERHDDTRNRRGTVMRRCVETHLRCFQKRSKAIL